MELFDTLLKRRSCRKYLENKEISKEDIIKLLKAGMAAPSAINKQPWEFIVIENKDIQSKIKEISPAYQRNSSLLIVVAGNKDNFIKDREEFWIEDCAAATENILLEATNLGLGSLWCGVFPGIDKINQLSKIINLPSNLIPFSLIHIGYSNETLEARTQYNENKIHYIK